MLPIRVDSEYETMTGSSPPILGDERATIPARRQLDTLSCEGVIDIHRPTRLESYEDTGMVGRGHGWELTYLAPTEV